MIKKAKMNLLYSLVLLLSSSSAFAAFVDYPVPPEYSFTGSLDVFDISGVSIAGPSAINFYPASGDFTLTYLDAPAVGYDSSVFTTPGTYSFNSTPDINFPSEVISMTVGAGQIGLRTFVEWNANIFDILTVWDVTTSGDTTLLTATDMDNDGIRGYKMVSGPYAGLNVTIDATIVTPIPAAVWMFGSGLIALAGFARRKARY